MSHAPVRAKVDCVDGEAGESLDLIVNPVTRKVTHVVVKLTGKDHKDTSPRLVPADLVAEVVHGRMELSCSVAELEKLDPFVEENVRLVSHADYQHSPVDPTGMMMGPVQMESYYVTEEVHRVPEGELAVSSGTKVEAKDGEAGHVVELILDTGTREITHFILERGGKEITLPLSAIDYVAEDLVYVKLDKAGLDTLPAVPARPKHGAWVGAEIEMVGAVFDDTNGADEALKFVTDLHHRGVFKLRNAAVLVKESDGKITVRERGDFEAKGGAITGLVIGGVVGLLTGGLGLLAAPALGAGAGAIAGKAIDRGMSNEFLRSLAERLQPGKSGLLVIVQDEWVKDVTEALGNQKGIILQQTLTDKMVSELIEHAEQEK